MENTQSEDEILENGTDMHMIDLQSKLHFDILILRELLCPICERENVSVQ